MDDLTGTNLTPSLSSNISTSVIETGLTSKTYVFPLVSTPTKVTFFVLLVLVGIVGLIGNILILSFLNSKKRAASFLRACTFQKNFDLYIKSLAISDALSALTANPSVCVQFYFNIFQQEWVCRAVRYVHILFRSVSLNNLLVINIGKYFSTRKVPRTFRHSTVKKQVWFAWIAPVFYTIIPAATFNTVVSYDYSEAHYTVYCRFDGQYLPFRIMFLSYSVFQYIIPCTIIIIISICLISSMFSRMKKTTNVVQDNAIKSRLRAAKRRGTIISIALVFAFVLPYLPYSVQLLYNTVAKAPISYETDLIIRYSSMVLAFSNGAIKFVIYLVQMKGFRAFLKEQFITRFATGNSVVVEKATPTNALK